MPVVLEIAERVRERAADGAWIVDFTNPVGIVTRALLDAGHRAVGLCNVAIGFQRSFARLLGVAPERVVVDQVGLNHLTWVRRRARRRGRAARSCSPSTATSSPATSGSRAGCSRSSARPVLLPALLLRHDAVLAEQLDGMPRAAAVAEIERELLELYRDPALAEKPALLEQRGGAYYSEAAIGLVASLAGGDGDVHEVDVRNDGTLAGLADDDVVEVPARVGATALGPLPQAPLAPELLGLVAARRRLRAAGGARRVTRRPVDARKALLAHPLIGQHEPVEELVERLLERARPQSPGGGTSMSAPVVLAVDGGNSKTDLALVAATARCSRSSAGRRARRTTSASRAASTCSSACSTRRVATAGLRATTAPVAEVGELLSRASTSRPRSASCGRAREARGWAGTDERRQRHFAVLRAGTERGWGVAVVCGAGINCVGVGPRRAPRALPPLGAITGDWGGGYDVGSRPVSAAARSEDGRGPSTPSSAPCPPISAWRRRPSSPRRSTAADPAAPVIELAPVVFAEAEDDAVAAEIVDRLAAEVVAMARVALSGSAYERAGRGPARRRAAPSRRRRLVAAIERGLREVGPAIDGHGRPTRRRSSAPPCSGSTRSGGHRRTGSAAQRARRGARRADAVRRRRRDPDERGGRAMADVRFEQATRIYPGTDGPAVDALDLHIDDGEFMVLVGPSGSGQDDGAADARRPRGGRRRRDLHRRPRRHLPAAEEARRRDGVPELRALPVPHRRGEHRLPAEDRQGEEGRARATRAGGGRAARPDRVPSSASRRSSRAASASGSRWGGRSSASRASS